MQKHVLQKHQLVRIYQKKKKEKVEKTFFSKYLKI